MSILSSIQERLRSFRHAFRGIRFLLFKEPNARIHLTLLILVIGAGLFFGISRWEWIAIALSAGLVMGMESLNAALEELADHVGLEHHERIGKLKDLAAGAVLIAAISATVVAALIFLPRLT